MNAFEKTQRFVMNTYRRHRVLFVKGEGCWLYDEKGTRYLDMLAGIAVCNLGHSHKGVLKAVCSQAERLCHVSNLFFTEPQAELAELICKHSFGKKVFFCNSGAEANETALKMVRHYGVSKDPEKCEIIAFKNSFHGRTTGALSITGQEKYRKGFGSLLPGVKFAEFNNIDSVKRLISSKTAGIVVEPIQGEGGVVPAQHKFLTALKELAESADALLVFDEVQTGIGRTGKLFAYQHYRVEPDVMTLAKALGNGFPIGAVVAGKKCADLLGPGLHASTFGGNPVSATAGATVVKEVTRKGFLEDVERKGRYLKEKLEQVVADFPFLTSVRGIGLMLGIVCKCSCDTFVKKALEMGLVINCAGGNVIRLTPPLTVTVEEIDLAVKILRKVFENHEG